jgi:hypothetical protein
MESLNSEYGKQVIKNAGNMKGIKMEEESVSSLHQQFYKDSSISKNKHRFKQQM